MRIFFWQFDDTNDIQRQWAMFIFNILVFFYTLITLIKTWRFYKRFMFELLPLSINCIATFIMLLMKLFQKGYEFNQINHLIEIFTYFLFCYTFALLYLKSSEISKKRSKNIQKIWNVILFLMIVSIIILISLVFIGIISKNCDTSQMLFAILAIAIQLICFAPTFYYGALILKKLKIAQHISNESQEGAMSIFTKDIYIRERKKQIYLVLSVFLLSLIFRTALSVTYTVQGQDFITCSLIDNQIIIITSDSVAGQIVLVIESFNELLPHIVIPIAMYIVPLRKMSKSIRFNSALLDEDEEDSSNKDEEQNQQRISSMLSSRMSDSSPSNTKKRKFLTSDQQEYSRN